MTQEAYKEHVEECAINGVDPIVQVRCEHSIRVHAKLLNHTLLIGSTAEPGSRDGDDHVGGTGPLPRRSPPVHRRAESTRQPDLHRETQVPTAPNRRYSSTATPLGSTRRPTCLRS
jgi:hypothetical protein